MKYLFTVVLGIALSVGICLAGEKLELKDEKDKASYSIGYQVGGDFKRQGLEIRPAMLLKGVQDALGNQETAMTNVEMYQTLVDLQKKVAAAQEQKDREEAKKNGE